MLRNTNGNSIIEVMVVIIIITTGIIGAYGILDSWQKLSTTAENRIKAINIAREWLEAVENIRDTNWIKFSSDYDNCWRTKDYNVGCIGNTGSTTLSGSNILVQSGTLWVLSGATATFPIYLDSNGLTSSSGNNTLCSSLRPNNCKTIFEREMQVSYPSDTDHMRVQSIVSWADSSKAGKYTINLETTLTNWKKRF